MNKYKLLVMLGVAIVTTGCVTGTRQLELDHPSHVAKSDSSGTVYIAEITDDRIFEAEPRDPSVPSVDGDLSKTSADTRASLIGRQRNGFGAAMGDVALVEGSSVISEMKKLLTSGLTERGYTISDKDDADIKVKVSIKDFWAWFSPGMWSVSFESKLRSVLSIDKGEDSKTVEVKGYGLNKGQVASDANWKLAYSRAFLDFLGNLDSTLSKEQL